jgi:polar amino acid transport system permease protein
MNVYLKGFLIACKGIPATVAVSMIAIVIGAAFGLLLALCSQARSKTLRVLAKIYVDVVRGTPMLVQALIMAYGIPWLLQSWGIGFKWDDFGGMAVPAVIVCGFNSSAYLSEVIRSGIQAIDKGQMEAARSLGMTNGQNMRYIVLPQAIKNILPAIANEFVTIIKESSICWTIGVQEIMSAVNSVKAATFTIGEALIIAACIYFCLTFPTSKIIEYFERKMSRGDKR